MSDVGNGYSYPISIIDVNYKDLIKDYIYLVDYKLVKEVDLMLDEKLYLIDEDNKLESEKIQIMILITNLLVILQRKNLVMNIILFLCY